MLKYSVFLFAFVAAFQVSIAQWSEQTSPVTSTLYSVSAVNNNVVWVCGAGGIVIRTTNGGTNWVTVTSPNTNLFDLYNIWGVDASTALVTGTGASATFVYKTTTGGLGWQQVFTENAGFIDAIMQADVNSNVIFMIGDPVGGRWSLWRSTNTGSTWDSAGLYVVRAGSEAGWNNALATFFSGAGSRIWFGTNNTRLYYSSGGAFTSQPTTGTVNSFAVWFNDSLRGMTGGSAMVSTTNGGANWSSLTTLGSGSINGITGWGNNWWYTRGTRIWYSANNGAVWDTDYVSPTGVFQHISKSRTGNTMWGVRTLGKIAMSPGPIGIQPISSEIPTGYVLHQNYPNPFNPATGIRFELPEKSLVRLVIYDAVGREVTQLLNEELRAGIYEVKWNSESYSTGVYYYTLAAGSFSETKKMVLIK